MQTIDKDRGGPGFGTSIRARHDRVSAWLRGAAAVATLAVSSLTHASLVQYSFTAVDGTQKTLAPNATYANAAGQITFTLDGGVTNKVQVKLLNGQNQLVNSAISTPIGPSDTIALNGNNYYGKQLQLPTPADGTYTIEADILDSNGKVVSATTYPLIQASKGPAVGDIVGQGYGACNTSGGPLKSLCVMKTDAVITTYYFTVFGVQDVKDTGAGIASATLTTKAPDGTVYFKVAATYNAAAGTITIGNGTANIGSGVFPTKFMGPVVTQFDIYDKAGNKTTVANQFFWNDSLGPNWSIAGVYNPNSSATFLPGSPFLGYDAYTPGMTTYANPIKLVIRVPKDQWYGNSPNGWFMNGGRTPPSNTKADYQDSQYAYKVVTFPYNPNGATGAQLFWQSAFYAGDSRTQLTYNLVLSPGVATTPVITNISYIVNGQPFTVPGNAPHSVFGKDLTIDRVTVNAQPQPIDQIVTIRTVKRISGSSGNDIPIGSEIQCAIPAGETSCSLTGPWIRTMVSGTTIDYIDYVKLYNADKSLSNLESSAVVFILDNGLPVFDSYNFDQKTYAITATGTKSTTGLEWTDTKMKSGQVTATSQATKLVTNLSTTFSTTSNAFSVSANAGSLADGYYSFSVSATDTAGNVTTQDVGTFLIDRTPPKVAFNVKDGASIASIGDILVSLSDPFDDAPIIKSTTITGGPANINISLPVQATDKTNQYSLLYPVLFPSLGDGGQYKLTVTATNKYGITGTQTLPFTYGPPTITPLGMANGVARTPAIPQVVTNVRTPALTLPNGQALTGQYEVQATLRSDSNIPLSVNGVTIQPGETKTIAASFDLTKNGSVLTFPVSPVTTGAIGKAYLLVTTLAPNAPVVQAEFDTWTPGQQIALVATGKATSYTVDVAPVTLIGAKTDVGSDCSGSIEYGTQATINSRGGTLNPGGYQCAIQVDADDGDLIDYTTTTQGVVGYVHKVGQNRAVYEPGVLYRDPTTSKIGFFTAGKQTLMLTGTALDDAAPVWTYQPGNGPQAAGSSITNPIAMLGSNQYAGQLKATAQNPGLTMVVTDPTSKATTLATLSNTLGSQIYTTDEALWDKLHYAFDVHYTRRPDKVWHTDLTLSVQPPNVTINLNRQVGALVSTNDATLSGSVGMLFGGAFTYNAATMGEWRVQAFVKTVTRGPTGIIIDTKLEPLSDAPTQVRSDGTFTLPVGQLPAGTANIVVKAILYDSNGPTERTVTTTDLMLAVSNGSPIPVSLAIAQATSGVVSNSAAFVPALNVVYDSKRLQDLGTIHWSMSSDNGATWQPAGDTASPGLRPRITESGTYQFKAVVTNKHSGLTSDTNTVIVEAFQRPTLSITGATAGYAGSPVTWTAVSDVADTSFTWSIKTAYNDQNPKTFTGKTVTFTPEKPGTLWVTLTGQESTGTIANPLRTRTASAIYAVAALALPKPIITGAHVLETGKPATFTVTQNSPFNKNQVTTQTIVGHWLLPDGTTRDGFDPVTVTIQPGQTSISYESWVDGLKDASLTKSGFTFSTWTYQFPKMVMSMSMPDARAPAIGVFTANYENLADARNVGSEKFTFDWSLPASANVTSERGATVGATFTQAGDQQVSVKVSDTRGNSQTLTRAFTVANAPTLAASLTLQGSDRWSRAPSNVQAVLSLSSMPKGDQISQIVYALDGVPALTATNPAAAAVIPVPTAGDHTISATITTKGGASFTASRSFSLVTGDNPVCTITQSGSTAEIVLRAACTVTQGKVLGINWLVNGEKTALSSAFITFTGQQLATLKTAGVIATTDKGQTGEASWTRP
ncbi:DUF4165 domain-containing protein [Burkholderia anthina]|uniref:DUF4165 domain-containing protein n=1 Tax=Burkholderia anthina TaxID=179879 RepID=UPI00158AE9D2|nr:DUF4165 domain-containing protein [Burkholderia anthina]